MASRRRVDIVHVHMSRRDKIVGAMMCAFNARRSNIALIPAIVGTARARTCMCTKLDSEIGWYRRITTHHDITIGELTDACLRWANATE